jgi:hypothetical protein
MVQGRKKVTGRQTRGKKKKKENVDEDGWSMLNRT